MIWIYRYRLSLNIFQMSWSPRCEIMENNMVRRLRRLGKVLTKRTTRTKRKTRNTRRKDLVRIVRITVSPSRIAGAIQIQGASFVPRPRWALKSLQCTETGGHVSSYDALIWVMYKGYIQDHSSTCLSHLNRPQCLSPEIWCMMFQH